MDKFSHRFLKIKLTIKYFHFYGKDFVDNHNLRLEIT